MHNTLSTFLMGMCSFLLMVFSLFFPVSANDRTPDNAAIMETLTLSSDGRTEVVKKFPTSFPNILTARGKPLIYSKNNSNNFEFIGMPVGGVGAGQLYLGGDGQLWFWDIYGLNYYHGSLKGEESYEFPYNRSGKNQKGVYTPKQGFSLRVYQDGEWRERPLNRDGFDDITFLGQYPIGEVTYKHEQLPVDVTLEAFSPFVPLALEKSMYPATILNYTVTNTSSETVKIGLNAWLENTILHDSRNKPDSYTLQGKRVNKTTLLEDGSARITYSANLSSGKVHIPDMVDYGTLSLTAFGGDLDVSEGTASADLHSEAPLMSSIQQVVELQAGESKTVHFILSWHFPLSKKVHHTPYRMVNKQHFLKKSTNTYAKLYKDSADVADHIMTNFEPLTAQTRLWQDTWYDSTLPYWFLDRTFLNTSILASTTSTIIDDFLFYGTEGNNQGGGTVTHVWGYVKAMGRLFPRLEKSLREQVDFVPVSEGGSLKENGMIRYRWMADRIEDAVDGQAGVILRTFLAHQMSKDKEFLRRVYQGVKTAMQGLTEQNDADHDGILTGPQHNTLDGVWYGKVTWLSLHYTAALRATAEMAREMDDDEFADFCLKLAERGREYIEKNLFNGEYFIHKADPDHPNSPGTYDGLEYSQLLGQSWAYHLGLGEILDPKKVKIALESMWRYNFTTDVGPFREKFKQGRWYAMPGESGLIACTWPNGGQDALNKGNARFAAYNNESQNGYEYAATSLMMWHELPYQSLAHIWYMHNDRYHGQKRNPWCEVEWGGHYARSMASYGHFTAASGYEYHGPKGYLAFSPNLTPNNFKSAYTVAEGWGSFTQSRDERKQRNRLVQKYGELFLKHLAFDYPHKPHKIKVTLNGEPVKYIQSTEKQRINYLFSTPIALGVEDELIVTAEFANQ